MKPIDYLLGQVYDPKTRKSIYHIVGNRADGEDAMQTIALDIWQMFERNKLAPDANLRKLILLKAKEFRIRQHKHQRRAKPAEGEKKPKARNDLCSQNPEVIAEAVEMKSRLYQFTDQLPSQQRQTVTQRLRGTLLSEIAQATGRPLGTVRSQWFFGTETLKKQMRRAFA